MNQDLKDKTAAPFQMVAPPVRTDFVEVLGEMNAGIFLEQLNRAISDVAANVVNYGKGGQVNLSFKISQIGNSNQVVIQHDMKFIVPMANGRITEELESQTPFHVGRNGKLGINVSDQADIYSKVN